VDSAALRSRRHEMHARGDHSICKPERCRVLQGESDVSNLLKAVRDEFAGEDETVRALAMAYVQKVQGTGPASVNALRHLTEWIADRRASRGGVTRG
jgi:hypothetical protein